MAYPTLRPAARGGCSGFLGCLFLLGELCAFQALADEHTWNGGGGDNNASTPANWVGGAAPTLSTDWVRLDGTTNKNMTWDLVNPIAAWTQTADYSGTVTLGTRYDAIFPCLVITGTCQILGGTWTHTANGATETFRLRASIGGDLTIGSSASLNVTGKGYARSQGPGHGNGSNNNGLSGASHGGLAGYPGDGAVWAPYGFITSPTNLGSGGMEAGGGAIDLEIIGTTTLQGSLLAKGDDTWAAGAAGGSIRLITGALNGGGVIDASAGATGQCGAGGGRIAVILTSGSSFGSLLLRAYGSGGWPGSAGTIYTETSTQSGGHGTLKLDNNGINTLIYTLMPPWETNLNAFATVLITNKAILALNTNTHLNLGSGSSLAVYGPSQSFLAILSTNHIQLPATWTLSNYTLRPYTNLSFSGNLTVSNATLEMALWGQTNLYVGGNLLISPGGTVSHVVNATVAAYRLALQVDGNLTLSPGGAIDVTGKGYGNSQGPGHGNGQNHNNHGGASYGGLAAYPDPDPDYTPFWVTYGSLLAPTNLGSGGMVPGGGAAEIRVGGTTTLNGAIWAKGADIWGAGSSGGSIYLTTAFLEGTGSIDASAGLAGQCGGGGGRISVILKNGSTWGTISLQALGEGGSQGAAGTIYRETAAAGAGHGVLTIYGDVAPYSTNTVTSIPGSTNATPADLTRLMYVTLLATNYVNVVLLNDLTMGDLFLTDDHVKLYLKGHTLTLKAFRHPDWGTPSRVVYDGGQIIWNTSFATIVEIH